MRSKASIKSHPIHPALVVYPIAFLHGSFACDLAGRITGKRRFYRAGSSLGLAGIAAAVVAAVPGLVDYIYTVPPKSSGKSRARKHILFNSGALALFGVAQWLRRRGAAEPGTVVLGAEAAGTGLLLAGAWLGSTLVNRNFVGPDHRYADAGRFSEERVPFRPGESVPVARADELEVNQMKLLRVNGQRIVLGRTEDGYVAFDDHCTHRGGSLADGVMVCGTVQCLWHGSQFDAATGEVRAGPAQEPIHTYPVEVVENEVRLLLEPAEERPREELARPVMPGFGAQPRVGEHGGAGEGAKRSVGGATSSRRRGSAGGPEREGPAPRL
jgi:nitrite reductase/ring-hydroxylating ferredoxin subunit/uncharacterized membrane protein